MNRAPFFNQRKARRERVLQKMSAMRAAKARKRQEQIADGRGEREPKFTRYHPFEFGVRVKATGETHFTDLRSARHAATALGLILKFYEPNPPPYGSGDQTNKTKNKHDHVES